MPNHIHVVVMIKGKDDEINSLKKVTLGHIIAYYKYETTKLVNHIRNGKTSPLWQRDYYEHIVRHDDDLNDIREYITYNPLKWELDKENPKNQKV